MKPYEKGNMTKEEKRAIKILETTIEKIENPNKARLLCLEREQSFLKSEQRHGITYISSNQRGNLQRTRS